MATVYPNKLLALSPHLDDIVFSCGELIASCPGTVVVTAFAGTPADCGMLTEWDRAAGFCSARQSVCSRREEDRSALELLSATPVWLDFCDAQYTSTPSVTVALLAAALDDLTAKIRPTTILVPAGLHHEDHVLLHQAALSIRERYMDCMWLMYEEAPYRRIPGLLQRRLAELLQDGVQATPIIGTNSKTLKKGEAIASYASQVRALQCTINGGYSDLFAPEIYWLLDASVAIVSEKSESSLQRRIPMFVE